MLALGAALLGAAFAGAGVSAPSAKIRQRGTFRIAYVSSLFTSIDPALALWGLDSEQLVDPTCGQLMNYPDKRPPEGLRILPEMASRYAMTNDGKTYTFTIRRGLRFSDRKPVTAQSFARAFVRALAPSMQSAGAFFLEDVVGAKDVQEGRLPAGIVARGNRLVIRLTKPVPDFLARMTLSLFCAVPSNLPIDSEGVGAPLPAAGPYYVAEYVPGRRLVLRRNRYYRGKRPHHVDSFVVDFGVGGSQEVIDRVKAGTADWGTEDVDGYFPRPSDLKGRRSQFFVTPGHSLLGFYLNSERPLFRNNARLRRAVNFAVDRRALVQQWGGPLTAQATDQYLPPSLPGFRNTRIYPLRRPNVANAKALARRHLRSRKAVMYIRDDPVYIAQAQIVKRNLAAIGLAVEIKQWPRGVYYQKLRRGEPWDIGQVGWSPDFVDPYPYLNALFASSSGSNLGFASPTYDRLLAKAARLGGSVRYRAYGELDVRLARDAAPMIAAFYAKIPTFVSKRVDPRCVIRRPYLDLAAVCLK